MALAEMAFSGGLGMEIFLSEVPYQSQKKRDESVLFSESNSRFVVEVAKTKQKEFEKLLTGVSFGLAGCLTKNPDFKIFNLAGKICVDANINKLKEAWQGPLRW